VVENVEFRMEIRLWGTEKAICTLFDTICDDLTWPYFPQNRLLPRGSRAAHERMPSVILPSSMNPAFWCGPDRRLDRRTEDMLTPGSLVVKM
jgi:hypothetical protein